MLSNRNPFSLNDSSTLKVKSWRKIHHLNTDQKITDFRQSRLQNKNKQVSKYDKGVNSPAHILNGHPPKNRAKIHEVKLTELKKKQKDPLLQLETSTTLCQSVTDRSDRK